MTIFWGTVKAGGYIWHTTGSGKTLTSFKTAQLLSRKEYIDKVLFVVDRNDLDYQTMREYNRFEPDAVNGNRSTEALKRQLENGDARIIVTTIQKLSVFIKKYPVSNRFHSFGWVRFMKSIRVFWYNPSFGSYVSAPLVYPPAGEMKNDSISLSKRFSVLSVIIF